MTAQVRLYCPWMVTTLTGRVHGLLAPKTIFRSSVCRGGYRAEFLGWSRLPAGLLGGSGLLAGLLGGSGLLTGLLGGSGFLAGILGGADLLAGVLADWLPLQSHLQEQL